VSAAKASKQTSSPQLGLSGPVEDYLKAIYELERTGVAETNAIAALLDIAPASVSGMVRRLADQGLITHERYHGARLTASGRRAALKTIRRHRVIESYLTSALGYSWDRVHDEAERLEHAASDELIDRMAAAIGEPSTDPHGAPIPARDLTLEEREVVPLGSLAEGDSARVERVSDDDADRLRYLAELGIVPGANVQVMGLEPYGGPITLLVGTSQRSIGPELAGQILVSPVLKRPRR
jgi:DtxR family transcriptional regulator, Mn-dependent transcriptional regulator